MDSPIGEAGLRTWQLNQLPGPPRDKAGAPDRMKLGTPMSLFALCFKSPPSWNGTPSTIYRVCAITHVIAGFAYLLALTSLSVIAGRLGDIFGRKRLLLSGFLLFSAASLLCGFATTLPWLIGARLAQGAGAAILMAMAMALAADIAPKKKAGSMMGLLGTMSAAGTALGPVLGGLLIAWLNWQAIFLAAAPAGALGLLLAHRFIPTGNPSSRKAPPFDVAGGVVLVMTLAAYALAMTGQKAGLAVHPGILLGAALALSALFVLVEKRAAAPLISVEMLRTPLLGSGLAMSVLVSTVMMATLVVGPFYLAYALGLGAAATGLVLAAGPVVAATTGLFGGKLGGGLP